MIIIKITKIYRMLASHAVLKKYWISKLVFKTLKKYLIVPKCTLGIERIWKLIKKNSEVSEQNFTKGRALHYLW